jgi:hypothetical protein
MEKIMNNIIKQYEKNDDPAFQTGLNIKIISGPKKLFLQIDCQTE